MSARRPHSSCHAGCCRHCVIEVLTQQRQRQRQRAGPVRRGPQNPKHGQWPGRFTATTVRAAWFLQRPFTVVPLPLRPCYFALCLRRDSLRLPRGGLTSQLSTCTSFTRRLFLSSFLRPAMAVVRQQGRWAWLHGHVEMMHQGPNSNQGQGGRCASSLLVTRIQ
jgi:hypothetical protein